MFAFINRLVDNWIVDNGDCGDCILQSNTADTTESKLIAVSSLLLFQIPTHMVPAPPPGPLSFQPFEWAERRGP